MDSSICCTLELYHNDVEKVLETAQADGTRAWYEKEDILRYISGKRQKLQKGSMKEIKTEF